MRLRAGAGTDTGRVRTLNEDVFAVRPEQGLFVVCDGMGGCPAGEVASQIAVSAILAELDAGYGPDRTDAPDDSGFLPQTKRLAAAVRQSNEVVYSESQSDPRKAKMGTTVVGAWIAGQIASVAHVGDSRAYVWRDDQLEPITRDHSLAEAYVEDGRLDRETSLKSEQQNILLRAIGREPTVKVDLNEVPVRPGDRLLLCSDGLTRMVSEQVMANIMRQLHDPQDICNCLIAEANGNGGVDNVTVLVVEVMPTWWQRVSNPWRQTRQRRSNGQPHVAV